MISLSKKVHTGSKKWCIYAIVSRSEQVVFVAKSCAKNPKLRYYEHLRGENSWTADDFGPEGTANDAEFIVLESIEGTISMAYRHIIAWCRYFEEKRFALLTSPKKSDQCDYLKPETQKIYDQVCAPFPLSEVLDREVIYEQTQETTEEGVPAKPKGKSQMTQLNVRVHESVAASFRHLCEQTAMSQNDFLAMLLAPENRARLEEVNAPWRQLQDQRELNQQLKKENEALRKKDTQNRGRERRYRITIAAFLQEIVRMSEQMNANVIADLYLSPPKYFKEAKRRHILDGYNYPNKDGVETIVLEYFVKGNSVYLPDKAKFLPTALFVLGRTKEGTKVKLRYYPRDDYAGIALNDKLYAYPGSEWFVGFMVASDGATDVIAAFPHNLYGGYDPVIMAELDAEIKAEFVAELTAGLDEEPLPFDQKLTEAERRAQISKFLKD